MPRALLRGARASRRMPRAAPLVPSTPLRVADEGQPPRFGNSTTYRAAVCNYYVYFAFIIFIINFRIIVIF